MTTGSHLANWSSKQVWDALNQRLLRLKTRAISKDMRGKFADEKTKSTLKR